MLFIAAVAALTAGWVPATVAEASEARVIELTDGTVVNGTVEAFQNGVYTISSPALGTLRIDGRNIRAIRMPGPTGATGGAGAVFTGMNTGGLSLEGLKAMIQGDTGLNGQVEAMVNDPGIQALLSDPGLVQAVNSGDINAIIANPKFMQLMADPQIQGLTRDIFQKVR